VIDLSQGDDQKTQNSTGENKKGKRKISFGLKIIIVLFLAVLLFAGGVFLAIQTGFVAGLNKHYREPVEKEPKFMFLVPEIIVNLPSEGRRQQYLTVKFYLGFDEPKLEKEIEKRMPELRDAVLNILWEKDATDINAPDGKEQLKEEMFQVINGLLNSGEIRDLYFWHVMVQ
jgi:flagellar FliL protein